jgi:pimeloyl-ACP methyl ester carboxylesterase
MPRAAANGIEIEYETFGRSGDPALLLVMGLGAQMLFWDDEFCARLAERSFQVVRYDNRDVGLSTKLASAGTPNVLGALLAAAQGYPVNPPYTLQDMARDAIGLLDALGIKAAHVVGSSMGGMIGQILAIEHADRVLSLTSIMSTSGDPSVPPASPDVVALLMKPLPLERESFIEQSLEVLRAVSGSGFPLEESAARQRSARIFERGVDTEGALRQFVAMLAAGNRRSALAGVRAPTLVIHGDADPLAHPAGGRDTAAAIPGAELLIVSGMGHALPPPVWPLVIEAIAKNARRARSADPTGDFREPRSTSREDPAW